MNSKLTSREARFAVEAVSQAARLARRIQQERNDHALFKDDRSPVTVADFAVQALTGQLLEQRFPDDPLVAEEDSAALRAESGSATLDSLLGYLGQNGDRGRERVLDWIDRGGGVPGERFWTLDPIDGTKGFLRGGQFAVALALVTAGRVVIAALGCPNLDPSGRQGAETGSIWLAREGAGCWAAPLHKPGEFTRVSVSRVDRLDRARILRSVESAHTNEGGIARFQKAAGTSHVVLMDSLAKSAVLACGGADINLRLLSRPGYREQIWDQAAGALMVEEAGGRVTDLAGRRLDFSRGRRLESNRGIAASNGLLHDSVLELLAHLGLDGK